MRALVYFLFVGSLNCGFSASVYGNTIADVQSASCKSSKGEFLTINRPKNQIVGQLGTLGKMEGTKEGTLDLLEDYPSDGLMALGSLVVDKNGYWGNLSLLSQKNQQLLASETMKIFFTDAQGNATIESMECDLGFK